MRLPGLLVVFLTFVPLSQAAHCDPSDSVDRRTRPAGADRLGATPSGDLFIAEQPGRVLRLRGDQWSQYLDLRACVSCCDRGGLLSVYGDWCSGRLWGARGTSSELLADIELAIVSFGEDDPRGAVLRYVEQCGSSAEWSGGLLARRLHVRRAKSPPLHYCAGT